MQISHKNSLIFFSLLIIPICSFTTLISLKNIKNNNQLATAKNISFAKNTKLYLQCSAKYQVLQSVPQRSAVFLCSVFRKGDPRFTTYPFSSSSFANQEPVIFVFFSYRVDDPGQIVTKRFFRVSQVYYYETVVFQCNVNSTLYCHSMLSLEFSLGNKKTVSIQKFDSRVPLVVLQSQLVSAILKSNLRLINSNF